MVSMNIIREHILLNGVRLKAETNQALRESVQAYVTPIEMLTGYSKSK